MVEDVRRQLSFLSSMRLSPSRVMQRVVALSATLSASPLLFVQLALVSLVTSAAVYVVKQVYYRYSTHAETYTWFWTLAYARGVLPASLILLVWVVSACYCFHHIVISPPARRSALMGSGNHSHNENQHEEAAVPSGCNNNDSSRGTADGSGLLEAAVGWLSLGAIVLANAAITITVNSLYIYSTQLAIAATLQLSIQLALAVFRIVYAYVSFPLLSKGIADPVENISFRFKLLMMNNLWIPFIATSLTSPSCFQVLM